MASEHTRTFLRWAGSKRQLLPVLTSYWNEDHNRYVEPFAGSACLFFRLQPNAAILGDINVELIATYAEVKHRLPAVMAALKGLRKGRQQFLELRGADVSLMTAAERAARFIYLNRFCFNGLYRTNRKGQFNVPYGGDKSGEIPSADVLLKCSSLLKNAELVAGSFELVLEKVRSGDFVYMDPPFSVGSRRVFNEYAATNFDAESLNRLRSWMEKLANKGIHFLVSYAECEEAEILQKGFYKQIVSVKRNISGFVANRSRSTEVLISSIPVPG